jgi:integrase
MTDLRSLPSVAALALEFAILTAARTGEVLGARWDEFDLNAALWTVPPGRMKGGIEHRVPLCARAIEILKKMQQVRESEFVFSARKHGAKRSPSAGLSPSALKKVLIRMSVTNATVHGFRSSFRDWCGDCTHYPREVMEAALAHVIENKAEAAYRRGTALQKRRELMRAWELFCGAPPAANVIPLRTEVPAYGT